MYQDVLIYNGNTVNNTINNTSINNTTAINNTTTFNLTLKITKPTKEQTVSTMYTVEGTTRPLKSNEYLYILIKPAGYNWWVQSIPTINNDGTWQCAAQFGENRNSGIRYTACALITTKKLSAGEYGPSLPSKTGKTEIKVTRS